MKKLIALALMCLLFGCGAEKLDGTYSSSWNGKNITFNPNGTAVVSRQDGGTLTIGGDPMPYTVEDGLIKMGALQLKLLSDGSIDGGTAYGKMIKK